MQRDDIIQAAAQIFRQKGYDATSMQDIADAVGLQKASLYHHVQSKQEILLVILDHALDLMIDDLQAVLASSGDPEDKIRRAVRVTIGRLTEDSDLAGVLLLEHRSLEPKLRSRHVARRDRYDALWRQLVQSGIDAGALRPVDVQLASFALLGVQNWTITWYREGGRLSVDQIADSFADLFLNGLRVDHQGAAA